MSELYSASNLGLVSMYVVVSLLWAQNFNPSSWAQGLSWLAVIYMTASKCHDYNDLRRV